MSQTTVETVETGGLTLDTRSAEAVATAAAAAPSRSPVCLLVAPVCVALAAISLAVAAAGDGTGPSGREMVRAALVVAWAFAGTTLGIRRREDRLGPLVLGAAALGGAGVLASALSVHADLPSGPADLADAGARMALALLPAVALHFLLALPDGRLGQRSRRVPVQIGYGVGLLTGAYLVTARPGLPRWPVLFEAVSVALAGVSPSHARYLGSGGVERRRLQWIGWAVAVAAEFVLVVVALDLLADWPHHFGEIALASTGLVPLALVAGTSPRLVARVDRLLTHTVSLAGLTALIVAVYVLVVVGLGRVPAGGERSVLLLSMAAAAIASLLYLPARDRLSGVANRLVYGEQAAPDEALRTFGSRLTRAIPLDELLLQLAESLRKTMRLASAEVWTGMGGRLERTVSLPHREMAVIELGAKEAPVVARAGVSGGTWLGVWLPQLIAGRDAGLVRVAPIAHGGELLGLIVAERRPEAEAFSEEDDRVLVELARQVGLALHNVQLDSALQQSLDELRQANEDLKRSRARIVAAGDAERRKLERNLHDGAQQHLVALAVKVRLARDAVEDDPAEAVAMLDVLKGDVQEAVAELRALAHGIFPPLLMAGGLPEALPAAAGRAAVTTTVVADRVGRYPQDVETAVYFCCLEALQNAGKHAGDGAVAEVRVWEDEGMLLFEVVDDGAGFELDGSPVTGSGFVNMGDRVGAIDGTLSVESSPGAGTRVRGSIPLGR
ncbi:MAG TPA: histidine kinase [Acidimicrobiales bacterium]|nr:histidine kinase [Acidimicrobiales bacterium]